MKTPTEAQIRDQLEQVASTPEGREALALNFSGMFGPPCSSPARIVDFWVRWYTRNEPQAFKGDMRRLKKMLKKDLA